MKDSTERMISLIDEKYIEEALNVKMSGEKKSRTVWFAAVAAVFALVFAGGAFLQKNASSDKEISETTVAAVSDEVSAAENNYIVLPYDYSEGKDYSGYFSPAEMTSALNIKVPVALEYHYYFQSDEITAAVPFSTEIFSKKCTEIRCYDNGNGPNLVVYLSADSDDTYPVELKNYIEYESLSEAPRVEIGITEKAADLPVLSDPNLKNVPSVERNGIDIYGVNISEPSESNLYAWFEFNGRGYYLHVMNLSCAEAVGIIDSLTENDFSAASYDITKAEKIVYDNVKISLEEANKTYPYENLIPQLQKLGGESENSIPYVLSSYDGTTDEDGKITASNLSVVYDIKVNDTDGRNLYADFRLYTSIDDPTHRYFQLEKVTREDIDEIGTPDGNLGDNFYYFDLIMDDNIIVEINALCQTDEVWEYVSQIKTAYAEKRAKTEEEALKAEFEEQQAEKEALMKIKTKMAELGLS